MHEVILDNPEIDVLQFEHTSLSIPEKPKTYSHRKSRKNDRKSAIIVAQWFVICALSILLYIAQAGPIW